MNYFLKQAKQEDKEVLFRLLQYSLFEESANSEIEMNENATFSYEYFEQYFDKSLDNRWAYLIYGDKKLIGFVMINTYTEKCDKGHSIAEFMICPKYRRKGIGKKIAMDCFNMHKGNWEVSPYGGNDVAYRFWKKVIGEYTNSNFIYEDGIFVFCVS